MKAAIETTTVCKIQVLITAKRISYEHNIFFYKISYHIHHFSYMPYCASITGYEFMTNTYCSRCHRGFGKQTISFFEFSVSFVALATCVPSNDITIISL